MAGDDQRAGIAYAEACRGEIENPPTASVAEVKTMLSTLSNRRDSRMDATSMGVACSAMLRVRSIQSTYVLLLL